MNVKPTLAAVAPRIHSQTSTTIPAVDLLGDVLDSRRTCTIAICGEKGWGKSVALAHLAASFPDRDDLQFWDSDESHLATNSNTRVNVFACRHGTEALKRNADCWMLAEWGLDEALEYLISCHRGVCEKLVPTLHSHAALNGLLPHRPILWRKLLDLMAIDASIATVDDGLKRIVQSFSCYPVADPVADAASVGSYPACSHPASSDAGSICHEMYRMILEPSAIAVLLEDDEAKSNALESLAKIKLSPDELEFASNALRLISEDAIFVPVAVNGFVGELSQQPSPKFLTTKLNARAIELVARRVTEDPRLLQKLNALIVTDSMCQSMAVSVLCRAIPNWRPKQSLAFLQDGKFDGVNWDGIKICSESYAKDESNASASRASFRGASLNGASLVGCFTVRTDFSNASLSGADLSRLGGREANFSRALLHRTKFDNAMLRQASFAGADCTGASFHNARLRDADLRDACFVSANLKECKLRGANLEGADFTRADFSKAIATNLDFRQTVLFEATFQGAKLVDCNFESLSLPMIDFIEADLSGAIFSDTVIDNGSFFGAKLLNARLGDINWENCDLRNVDLRGATFHYGSTRSGLVGSPYPSHGTRTGFYTDDFYDQPFKAPEEIRKANLCGADLRGANITNVDFYLVDLRDARLDYKQAEHVRQCGAILAARV